MDRNTLEGIKHNLGGIINYIEAIRNVVYKEVATEHDLIMVNQLKYINSILGAIYEDASKILLGHDDTSKEAGLAKEINQSINDVKEG